MGHVLKKKVHMRSTGCTTIPGFTPDCFETGRKQELLASYPQKAGWIQKLGL
ncbi:MAG: hypothetical protein WCR31_09750 [Treponema sp.]